MSNDNVRALPPSENFTPDQALHSALRDDLSDVLVLGYADGVLCVRSSRMSRADALWLLEAARDWVKGLK